MSRGHLQEIKDEVGVTVAWRAVISHPTTLTKSGSAKRLSRQFAVGFGLTSPQAKKAAQRWLDETRQILREGKEVIGKSKFRVSDAADAWLSSIEIEGEQGRGKLRDSTLIYYEYLVRCYIHEPPAGVLDVGTLRLNQVDPPALRQWVQGLIRIVSRDVARRALTTMKAILRFSVNEKWIGTNPASELKLGTERHDDDSITIVLEREHVIAILNTAKDLAERGWVDHEPANGEQRKAAANRRKSWAKWYPFFRLAFFSGARTGELLASRAHDFIEEASTFRIERTLTKAKRGQPPQVGAPKTKRGKRTIAIDPACVTLIKARVDHLDLKPDAYVFGTASGKVDNLSNVRRAWISLLELASARLRDGLEPLILPDGEPITSPYHSRHYHASELLRSGASLDEVSERLGHRDTVITQRHYAHLLGDRSQASRAISDRFTAALSDLAA